MEWDGNGMKGRSTTAYMGGQGLFFFFSVMIECMDRLGRFSVGLKIRLACLFGALDTYIRYECNDLPSLSRALDVLLIGPPSRNSTGGFSRDLLLGRRLL